LVEERRRATIVFAHDWGADGAQANVEHQIKTIGRSLNAELEVTTVPGIPPLGSPLIAAIEFDRVIDTHRITLELCARKLEAKGLSKDEIEKKLSNLVLINVFDRGVGSERVAAIVEGKLKIKGADGDYLISVALVGPLNNGIIGALVKRLDSVTAFDLANAKHHVDDLGCVTWDGRTKFGPVAALYASGTAASEFGKPVDVSAHPRIAFEPIYTGDSVSVPLVDIDPIGNLVLGLRNGEANKLLEAPFLALSVAGRTILTKTGHKFSDVGEGELIAYRGSNGLLEIAINNGDLARQLNLSREQGHLELIVAAKVLQPATVFELQPVSEAQAREVA